MKNRSTWGPPLAHWAFFVVGLSLVPFIASYIVRAVAGAPDVSAGQAVPLLPLERGDLFLVAATIAFTGVGLLLGRKDGPRITVVGGVAALNGMIAALAFAGVTNSVHPNGVAVGLISGIQYLVSAIAGGACAVLSALAEGVAE